jgi:hypothetical protein
MRFPGQRRNDEVSGVHPRDGRMLSEQLPLWLNRKGICKRITVSSWMRWRWLLKEGSVSSKLGLFGSFGCGVGSGDAVMLCVAFRPRMGRTQGVCGRAAIVRGAGSYDLV